VKLVKLQRDFLGVEVMGESSGDSGNDLKLIVNIFFTSSIIRFLFFYILDV
jgi:hypothetical protein